MANNERTQFPHIVFEEQSNTPKVQQPLSGVGQDKSVLTSDRIASQQPASLEKLSRSHRIETKNTRSQNRPTAKRRTVPLQLWVDPLVKAEIQRTADREGLSASKVGSSFLEDAIRQDVHAQYNALLQPMMRQIIREELRTFSNRLVFFLMRIAFASEQGRILITNVLDRILRREGVSPDTFTNLVDQSSKMARRNILHKTPQLKSLLEEWERLFQDAEGDNKNNYG